MRKLAGLVPHIPHQPDHLVRHAGQLGSRQGIAQEGLLGDERPGARVLQLAGELVDGVGRVGGGRDAAGPVDAKVDDGVVDVVGGVEAEDVALAPAVAVDEAGAEAGGEGGDLGVAVGASRVAVYEDGCGGNVSAIETSR